MAVETLRDLWVRNAKLHPNSQAVSDGHRSLTYSGLLNRATRLAGALAQSGVEQGDRVAILSMNSIEYIELLAANHILGSIAATLNFRLTASEIVWILEDSAPRVLFFESRYLETLSSLQATLSKVMKFVLMGDESETPAWAERYDEFIARGIPKLPLHLPRPEDIAHLIYTSGTTGRPKGVMRSHRCEVYMAEGLSYSMDARTDSRILEVMPLFHTGAQSSCLAAMWRAGTVFIDQAFNAERLVRIVEREKITHLHLVPLMIHDLLDVPDLDSFDLSSLDTLLYAAAPITPAVLRRGIERFGKIFIGAWGMTEGGSSFLPKASHNPDGTPEEVALLSSVGQEAQRAEIRIVNEEEKDCAVGVPGELILRSAMLMSGYWNNSVATIEAMGRGWLRTGDMGYFDEQRNIYLVDRKKDMIISGGENIYSQEIERALAEHSDVDRAAVIGVPDERWGEVVKAVVVLRPGATAGADDIIEHCGRLIASYKKPKTVEFVDELPVLPSGKVNKVVLRKRFSERA